MWPFSSQSSSKADDPATSSRVRQDLIAFGIVILAGCAAVLRDPDRVFEWIAGHEAVQVDEFLTAVVIIGFGFAIFSWRRWTDLSRQIAEYKRLQLELSGLNLEASRMSETDDLLQSCLTAEEAYRIIIRHFEMQFPAVSGAICTITPARDTVEVMAQWGKPALPHGIFPLRDCWALRRGRVHTSVSNDPRLACVHIEMHQPLSAMCVPMMAQGETLGMLYLDTGVPEIEAAVGTAPAKPFTDSQERVVKMLAEHLSLAVANLNLRETLRTQSIRDPLTGLFNRRYMEESLEREFRRALRRKVPLAVVMLDMDHFKKINDTYGHEGGDAVLREMAKLFQMQLRGEDIACRYGGEEFMLLLPETTLEAARECAERLREGVTSLAIQHYGQIVEGVRISCGVACSPQHGNTVDGLIHAADMALYRAKEEGRDRVVIAAEA